MLNYNMVNMRYEPYPLAVLRPALDPSLYNELADNFPDERLFGSLPKFPYKLSLSEKWEPDNYRRFLRENRKENDGPLTHGVAQALPFASGIFDFVTMGIALRHVSDLKATFSEYARVLKPGGRVWLLEGHVARSRIGHALTKLVWAKLVPGLTFLFTRDRDAKLLMDYYWDTIDQCVPPEQIVEAMRDAGFEHARMRITLPGAFCEYKGQKAAANADLLERVREERGTDPG